MSPQARRITGGIILAPFLIPLGIFTMIAVIPFSILGFPIWFGLSLMDGEPLLPFYKDLYFGFAIFPFKIMLGLDP